MKEKIVYIDNLQDLDNNNEKAGLEITNIIKDPSYLNYPISDLIIVENNGDNNEEKEKFPVEIDSYGELIGVIREEDNNKFIDYYHFDNKIQQILQFKNESMGNFLYYKNLEKVHTQKVITADFLFETTVYIENCIHKIYPYISEYIKDPAHLEKFKHTFYVTDILINYKWQDEIFEYINGETKKICNCLADNYFCLSLNGIYEKKCNDFISKFQGFNTCISHKYNVDLIEDEFYNSKENQIII